MIFKLNSVNQQVTVFNVFFISACLTVRDGMIANPSWHESSLQGQAVYCKKMPMDLCVEHFIPHRSRMKLVDEILRVSEKETVTRSTVTENWPCLRDGFAEAFMLMEVVAQTTGIHNEWLEMQKDDTRCPSGGWLVGVRDAAFCIPVLEVGTIIVTRTKNIYTLDDFREISGQSTANGKPAATVRLQIVQASKP